MILRIAKKEMTEMVRDGRFRIAGVIVFTLLTGALLLGWQHYREVSAQHATAQRATREHWLNQGNKNPHSAAHYGIYAFKPKIPLSLVDQGTEPYTGVAAWLEAHKQNEFKYKPAQDATAIQRLGELTGATVLQLLVPLLIVVLAFNTFSGEREQGTLRQLASLGVRREKLAIGKAAGVSGALFLLLAPAAVIGSIAVTLASSQADMGAAVPRMAGMALGYFLYYGAFAGVTLAVSAVAPSSRSALVLLLGFWMFDGLVAPRAASDIARAFEPAPSAFEFGHKMEMALKNGIDGHDPADARVKRLEAELLAKYKVTRIEDLPVNFNGVRLQEGENHGNVVFDRAYDELWAIFTQQDRVRRMVAFLAPGLAARAVSMGFAGTDFPQHAHFSRAAEEYRRTIQRVMNDDLIRNASNVNPYLAGDDLWKRVPPFTYTAPAASWVLSKQAPALAILALWFVAASGIAMAAVYRMRVA
jgi:ABC-2 type transport system permease protein